MSKKSKEVFEKLAKYKRVAQSKYIRVEPKAWGLTRNHLNELVAHGQCCILGAVVMGSKETLELDEIAAKKLGITLAQAISIRMGFDGYQLAEVNSPTYYKIGAEFREQWRKEL